MPHKAIIAQRISLEPHRNPSKAQEMAQYMKNRFAFMGVARPDLKAFAKPMIQASQSWSNAQLMKEVTHYFFLHEREYQYISIDLILAHVKTLTWENWQKHLFQFIGTPDDAFAWWDSVDHLRKPLGLWLLSHPQHLAEVVEAFQTDASFWKRRMAITVQLLYKEKTNTQLLAQSIACNLHENEFFIQKGIGWALRDYSKTNPEWVRGFMGTHALSKLVLKEGSKYL